MCVRAAIVWIILIMCASCANDVADEHVEPMHTVEQRLAVDFIHGGHSYELGSVYLDSAGNAFAVDTLRFLLSAMRTVDEAGVPIADEAGAVLLVDAANPVNEFALGPLTAAHMHGFEFSLGMEAGMNHTPPPAGPANAAGMYSGDSATGYCFLLLTGRVDSNGDGDVSPGDQAFSFRCMGDALFRNSSVPVHVDVVADGELVVRVPVDMEKLLAHINYLNTPSAIGTAPITNRLMDQLVEATYRAH